MLRVPIPSASVPFLRILQSLFERQALLRLMLPEVDHMSQSFAIYSPFNVLYTILAG